MTLAVDDMARASRARNGNSHPESVFEPATLHNRTQGIDDCTWAIDNADRLTVLIDAEAYYSQLDHCFRHAQASIYINGWDLDTCIPLTPTRSAQSLADFIEELLADRPGLQVHILLWQMIAVQASNRGLPPFRKSWRDHPRIHFRYDITRPVESSRHEKIVVVDRTIAFMGSTDISRERWDVQGHGAEAAPYRINADGEPYRPHHDLQAMLTGPAAVRLADYFESAWNASVGAEDTAGSAGLFQTGLFSTHLTETSADNRNAEAPTAADGAVHASAPDESMTESITDDSVIDDSITDDSTINAFWPNSIPVQFQHVPVHFSRTAPEFADSPGIREVECMIKRIIDSARQLIFIEMQYLTSSTVTEALVSRLQEEVPPHTLIILPRHVNTLIERRIMGPLQSRQLERIIEADHADRLRVCFPALPGDDDQLMLHSKLTIIDDEILHLGSANFNERSMRVDSELDFTVFAANDAERASIRSIRHDLLAEHTGLPRDRIEELLPDPQALFKLLEDRRDCDRALKPYPVESEKSIDNGLIDGSFSDPQSLYAARELQLMDLNRTGIKKRLFTYAALAITGFTALVLLWSLTPAEQWLQDYLIAMGESRSLQSVLTITLVLLFASLLLMPITLITVVCFVLLGPWWGMFSAIIVSMASGGIAYWGGRWLDARWLARVTGPKLEELTRKLSSTANSITLVVLIRLMPVAPFTVVNLAMGAGRIRFWHFMLGSFLGLLPGKIVLALFADQTLRFMANPSLPGVLLFVLLALATIGLVYVTTRWLEKRSPIDK